MHRKIRYTPQFYCLKNLCSFRLSLQHFFECSPRTLSLLLLLRSKHSASGRTIWAHADTKQYATGSQELVLQGLQRVGQSTDINMTDTKLAAVGKCVVTILQVHSPCQEGTDSQDAKLL